MAKKRNRKNERTGRQTDRLNYRVALQIKLAKILTEKPLVWKKYHPQRPHFGWASNLGTQPSNYCQPRG